MESSEETQEPDYRFTLANQRTSWPGSSPRSRPSLAQLPAVELVPALSISEMPWARAEFDGRGVTLALLLALATRANGDAARRRTAQITDASAAGVVVVAVTIAVVAISIQPGPHAT